MDPSDTGAYIGFLSATSTQPGRGNPALGLLELAPGRRCLEVGSGLGEDARSMAAAFGAYPTWVSRPRPAQTGAPSSANAARTSTTKRTSGLLVWTNLYKVAAALSVRLRSLLFAGGVLALLVAGAAPVFAAIDASVAPAAARPGDWVELTTDSGVGGTEVYAAIAAGGPTPVYLQRADPSSTGNLCDTTIGAMTWASGVGTLRFQVPDVGPGPYWITASIQGACWRVGDLSNGVLVLTVLPGATPWLPLVLITGTAAIALLLVGLAVVRRVRRTLTGLTDRPSGR